MKFVKKSFNLLKDIFFIVVGMLFEKLEQWAEDRVINTRIQRLLSVAVQAVVMLIWISLPEGLWQALIISTTLLFGAWRFSPSTMEKKYAVKFMALFSIVWFAYIFLAMLLEKNPTGSQLVVGSIYGAFVLLRIFYEEEK